MIDYCAHVLSMKAVAETLDKIAPETDHSDAWTQVNEAVAAERGYALLGTLIDHLIERSEGAEKEHELLEEAVVILGMAAKAISQVERFRTKFESMVKSPETATVAEYRHLVKGMELLKDWIAGEIDDDGNPIAPGDRGQDVVARIKEFRAKAMPPFDHIPRHGASEERPVQDWLWRDVHTGRRTDAFVRALASAGDGSNKALALSFGALVSYTSNCVGSSYLTSVVGGPRRSHLMRDRVVRYAVGGWLRRKEQDPTIWPTFSQLHQALTLEGNPSSLPNAVETQISTALAKIFPDGGGAPANFPDLQSGYQRLLRHLELLDAFQHLPLPVDVDADLLMRIESSNGISAAVLADPQAEGALDTGSPDLGGPGGLPEPPTVGEVEINDNGCFSLFILILALGIIGIIVVIILLDDADSGENPQSSQQALDNFLKTDEACKVVAYAYHVHTNLHESASRLIEALKRIGLLYPNELDLEDSVFAPLCTAPDGEGRPYMPVPDAYVQSHPYHYLKWPPHSDLEPPTETYLAMKTPDLMLTGNPNGSAVTVGDFGAEVWLRHQDDPGAEDVNLNSDADRGFAHPWWRGTPGVSVQILGYNDIT